MGSPEQPLKIATQLSGSLCQPVVLRALSTGVGARWVGSADFTGYARTCTGFVDSTKEKSRLASAPAVRATLGVLASRRSSGLGQAEPGSTR